MDKPEESSQIETPKAPTRRGTSQSATSSRHPHSNSSTRRSHFYSAHTEQPRSAAGSREDIMFRSLHHRSSHRAGSRSRQDGDHVVELDSRPGTGHRDDDHAEQATRNSAVVQTGYQTPVQFDNENREASDDAKSIASVRSEQTFLQRRDLGMFDVAALIINKQIGTGIFTTPGLVLSLTGSKTISIVMWFCGGIWAFLRYVLENDSTIFVSHSASVIIYVEFGTAFPFNGGELIYVCASPVSHYSSDWLTGCSWTKCSEAQNSLRQFFSPCSS
jgi:hypothetical protein